MKQSLITMVVAAGITSGSTLATVAQTPAPIEVSIALSSSSIAAASPRLSERLGLYEKNGLKVRFVVTDNGNAALAALVGGSTNLATAGMDDIIPLKAQGQQDVVVVANLYRGVAGVLVVRNDVVDKLPAKPGDPVEARLKALDGLLLAATSPTSAMVGPLKLALGMVGSNVRMTYMQLPAMYPAMKTGAVQALLATSPYWEQAVEAGIATRWISGPKGEFPDSAVTVSAASMITTRAYADRNGEVMRRLRAISDQFAALVRERPTDVLDALKQLYPDLSPRIVELSFEQNSPSWTHPDLSEADVRKEIDMRKGGPIANLDKVDPRSLLLPR